MNENFPVHFILRQDCTDRAADTQLFIEKPMYTRYNARIDLELQKQKKGAVMLEKIYNTPCGIIRYWINKIGDSSKPSLIFLTGLTADHRLFEKQISYFENNTRFLFGMLQDTLLHGRLNFHFRCKMKPFGWTELYRKKTSPFP